MIFEVAMAKNGYGQSDDRTLKLAVSQKGTDGINWFFVYWYKSGKLKLIQWFLGSRVQKWSWPFTSLDPKICHVLRINLWIKLIFWMQIVVQSFLARLISYSLTFKYGGSTAVVLLVRYSTQVFPKFYLMWCCYKWEGMMFLLL